MILLGLLNTPLIIRIFCNFHIFIYASFALAFLRGEHNFYLCFYTISTLFFSAVYNFILKNFSTHSFTNYQKLWLSFLFSITLTLASATSSSSSSSSSAYPHLLSVNQQSVRPTPHRA